MDHVRWVIETTDSVWLRDYGPQFIYEIGGNRWGIVDFHYINGRPNDDDTPEFIADVLGVPLVDRQNSNVVYTEGGNLNHDGLGCVIYSQRTYNNNLGVDPEVIDQRIMSAFQATTNIVPEDPTLDMTGHVDMFQKIIGEDSVLVAQYDPDEVDYQILEDCATLYRNSTNGAGEPWNVVRIRQPDVYYIFFVYPVVRTYTNSLIVNNVVLLCTFGIDDDQDAIDVYEQVFPNKTILPIEASDIIRFGGAWHCVTMEYPSPNNPD
jgi:agmatine deiminase